MRHDFFLSSRLSIAVTWSGQRRTKFTTIRKLDDEKKANDQKEKVNGVQGGDPKKLHGIFDDIDMEDIGKKIKK